MQAEELSGQAGPSSVPASPDAQLPRTLIGPSGSAPPEDSPVDGGGGGADVAVEVQQGPLPPLSTEDSSALSAYSAPAPTHMVDGEASAQAAEAADGRGAADEAASSPAEGGDDESAAAAAADSGDGADEEGRPPAATQDAESGAGADGGADVTTSGEAGDGPIGAGSAAVVPGTGTIDDTSTERRPPSVDPAPRTSGTGDAGGLNPAMKAGPSRDGSAERSRPQPDAAPARPRSQERAVVVPPVPVAAAPGSKPPTPSGLPPRASSATPPASARHGSYTHGSFDAMVVGHTTSAATRVSVERLDVVDMIGHDAAAHHHLNIPHLTPSPLTAATAASQRVTSAGSGPAISTGGIPPGHSGPVVGPFAERQRSHGSGDSRLGTPQGFRRPGQQGSIRYGSAHTTPLPGSPTGGTPGRMSPNGTRLSKAASQVGQPAVQSASSGARASTADGAASVVTAQRATSFTSTQPPQAPASNRDKPRSGHAAGGGAAAVKAAAAAAGKGASNTPAGATSHEQQLAQQLMLGEAIQITGVNRTGVGRSSQAGGGGAVGVPGRRGRRIQVRTAATSASSAATAAYFADLEAEVAAGTAASKVLLPSGLARRLKAARMMASGPPPFQRRREPPPPPTPAGVKLDGFMLLEAADEEMPEAVQAASLESHSISAVESADLSYFVALRNLDLSDNRLPDLACLAPLQALVRLRAASCRMTTLGRWRDGAADTSGGGGEAEGASRAATSEGAKAPSARTTTTGAAARTTVTGTGSAPESAAATRPGTGGSASAGAGTEGAQASGSSVGTATTGTAPAAVAMAAGAEAEALLLQSSPLVPNPFQRLELLDLSFNRLPAHMVLLPGCPLALLPRLTELDLSSNHLRHLPSPAEIRTAAAVQGFADAAAGAAAGAAGVAFPALRRLRLADNGLKGSALSSLAALSPPLLAHLDLSHNAIVEAPRPQQLLPEGAAAVAAVAAAAAAAATGPASARSGAQRQSQQSTLEETQAALAAQEQAAQAALLSGVLPRLEVLDLSFNRVAVEAAVAVLTQLAALKLLLLAGNPLANTAIRPHASGPGLSPKLRLAADAAPSRPSVAASLTSRFARIAEAPPKQQASNLAVAAAAAITAATAPERVTEVFDRMDATIEQWRLNTVMEEDEEEEEEDEDDGEDAPEDRTFLTGVGIQEKRRKAARQGSDGGEEAAEPAPEPSPPEQTPSEADPAAANSEAAGSQLGGEESREAPLWESISDPTERLAVALGLDPLSLPMHTGVLTTDSAGAIAALRFALAHPLVEADDGLAPHPHYAAATTATQLKRKPRRPAPSHRLAPMEATAATAAVAASGGGRTSPRGAKIQTVEAMLDGMKSKLAALEASLAAQLAAAPAAPAPEAVRAAARASKGRYGAHRGGRGATGSDTDSDTLDDGASTGSGLPDDVIDQIERESESEPEDLEAETTPMDPMQGIVLLADQVITEEPSGPANVNVDSSQAPVGGMGTKTRSRSASPSPSRTPQSGRPSVAVSVSTSPPQQLQPGPPRPAGSPQRPAVSSRKSLGTAGSLGQAPSVTLPGGAASALGYAS